MRYVVMACLPVLDRWLFAWHGLAEMPIDPQIPPMPLIIEFLAFPDVQLLDVTGAFQVLASANRLPKTAGNRRPTR